LLNKATEATENQQDKDQEYKETDAAQTFSFNFHAATSLFFLLIYVTPDQSVLVS